MPLKQMLWLMAGVWVAAAGLLWPVHGSLLNVDEVDYLKAARLGVVANALERGSLSIGDSVRFGAAKFFGKPPALPPGYAEGRDPLLLRHYHPPFVVYLLSTVARAQSERVLRVVQLLGAWAFCTVVLGVALGGGRPVGWTEALIVSVFALQLSHVAFATISFHGWEAVWVTGCAGVLGRWLEAPRTATALFFCVAGALAVLTLETGVVVWLAAGICLLVYSSGLRDGERSWRAAAWRLGAWLGLSTAMVVAVWPGSVVSASLGKAGAFYGYRLLKGTEYAGVAQRLPHRLPAIVVPVVPLLVFIALSLVYLLRTRRVQRGRWGPFLIFGLLYAGVVGWIGGPLLYLVPALASLLCLVGRALPGIGSTLGRYGRIGLVVLVVGLVVPSFGTRDRADRDVREDLAWLRSFLGGREVLADLGQFYQYYLGPAYAIQTITVSEDGKGLVVREHGRYRPLRRGELAGKVVLIQRGREYFFVNPIGREVLRGCSQTDRLTVRVFDCPAA